MWCCGYTCRDRAENIRRRPRQVMTTVHVRSSLCAAVVTLVGTMRKTYGVARGSSKQRACPELALWCCGYTCRDRAQNIQRRPRQVMTTVHVRSSRCGAVVTLVGTARKACRGRRGSSKQRACPEPVLRCCKHICHHAQNTRRATWQSSTAVNVRSSLCDGINTLVATTRKRCGGAT